MPIDLTPVWLTLQLAAITTILLLILSMPIAWWLAFTPSRWRTVVEAVVALPLVLPPTVLGFYFLILLGPAGPIGKWWVTVTGEALTFSFSGLVVASLVYSLPFAVQPLAQAFAAMGRAPLEQASVLGASPADRFFNLALPSCRRGLLTAAVLTFAHTVGEFGIVLMVGGNIPGKTKVLSIAIYENVEVLNFREAHLMSAGLLVFSFLVLLAVFVLNRKFPAGRMIR